MALREECEPQRLTASMRSRKLQALDFIKRYYAQWGHSPTLGELAAGLGGISTKRAYDLVHQLSDERQLEVTAGKTRGIRLLDRGEELSEADVLLRIAALGWTIVQGGRLILPPNDPEGMAAGAALIRGLTEKGLPPLDFIADDDLGDMGPGEDGDTSKAGAGARAAAPARGAAGSQQGGMGAPSS
jgi:hypothetical protein